MRSLILLLALLCQSLAWAIDPLPFKNLAEEQRFQHLAEELRCLQCQNQNLADSEAGLAQDMRKKVFELMREGKSDQEIKQFMVDRYGDFVVYSPPKTLRNSLLWLLPFGAFFIGVAFVYWHFGRRRNIAQPVWSEPKDSGDDW